LPALRILVRCEAHAPARGWASAPRGHHLEQRRCEWRRARVERRHHRRTRVLWLLLRRDHAERMQDICIQLGQGGHEQVLFDLPDVPKRADTVRECPKVVEDVAVHECSRALRGERL
jgi:hypothetical protein